MPRIGLWLTFLAAAVLCIACSGSSHNAAGTLKPTVSPELDRVVKAIIAKDVDSLVGLVGFTPLGCVATAAEGAPPTCQPGEAEGSPVQTFEVDSCAASFFTTSEEIRRVFERELSRNSEWRLYAIVRGGYFDRPEEGYIVAVAGGSTPTAPGLLWHVTADGKIDAVSGGCGAASVATTIELAVPNASFVAGPLLTCSPGPGESVALTLVVDGFTNDAPIGSIYGQASPTSDEPNGERAIVHLAPATEWQGAVQGFDQLRPGMKLQVTGKRQDDCSIVATKLITLEIPLTTPTGGT
jgi:hypothetical protein